MKMHDYQETAYQAAIFDLSKKIRTLLVMASGLGKTIVAAFLAKFYIEQGQKVLFLCHDTGILKQALCEFRKVLGESTILKTFFGLEKDWEADKATVVFASFQTFSRGNPFLPNEFDFIVVDESHHGQAPTYKEVIDYFHPQRLIGLTATPDRMDLKDIREIFGDEVIDFSLEQAIAFGWLTPVEYHVITDDINTQRLKKILKDVLDGTEKITVKQLNETIFVKKRDEEIVKIIKSFAEKRKTIIFCERLDHVDNFLKVLPEALTYHSGNSGEINDQNLATFKSGQAQFILSVNKFNEGIDVPDAEMVVFLRATDSKTIFLQQLGRGLRKIAGKEKVLVLDFVANCERLIMVEQLVDQISTLSTERSRFSKRKFQITGNNFNFLFSDEEKDLLEIIKKIQQKLYISDIPELTAEFDLEFNEPLTTAQLIAGTNKKLWWRCSKCGHLWQATGADRVRGYGCPACSNKVVTEKNNMAITHPELTKEFDREKNAPLIPENLIAGTQKKLWWCCQTCDYKWQATGADRKEHGCPACSGRVPTATDNLAVIRPDLAAEFDIVANAPVTPQTVKAGTTKKIWWRCMTCGHKWQATGAARIKSGGCPAHTGRVPTATNNMSVTHPQLAKEFDYEKNAPLAPEALIAGTNKKLWWRCQTCDYKWQATGAARVRGNGCPSCSNRVVTVNNNMAVTHPQLAQEFDREKNAPLTPETLVAGTGKRLWWRCQKCGHSWLARGSLRVFGRGCPKWNNHPKK